MVGMSVTRVVSRAAVVELTVEWIMNRHLEKPVRIAAHEEETLRQLEREIGPEAVVAAAAPDYQICYVNMWSVVQKCSLIKVETQEKLTKYHHQLLLNIQL